MHSAARPFFSQDEHACYPVSLLDQCVHTLLDFTGSFPSHLILAFRHLEQAATGLETFKGGVSRGISVAASISSIFMVSILPSYPSTDGRQGLKPLNRARKNSRRDDGQLLGKAKCICMPDRLP